MQNPLNWHEYVGVAHIHSTDSDGSQSVPEIISIGKELGLDFLMFSDHMSLNSLHLGLEIKVVLLGSEEDRGLCDQIAGLMREKPLILAGKTDILQTTAVISLCSVVLSNDSAPVHLASAMKKPVVAIFGSTVPEFGFAPYKVPHLIIQKNLTCRPCGIHGKRKCPEKHFNCMREITAEEVFKAVLSLV